jgi:hypothetical protein
MLVGAEVSKGQVEAGRAAEAFAFVQLQQSLPDFTLANWRSGNRLHFYPHLGRAGLDDTLGYDFEYEDVSGALSTHGAAKCLIEVKACSVTPSEARFYLTANELDAMRSAQQRQAVEGGAGLPAAFVIVLVASPLNNPQMVRLTPLPNEERRGPAPHPCHLQPGPPHSSFGTCIETRLPASLFFVRLRSTPRHLESRPKASARLVLEASAGWASPSSRGLWGGDALLLSTDSWKPKPETGEGWRKEMTRLT